MPRFFAALLLGACILYAPAFAQPVPPLLLVRGAETPIQLQQATLAVDIGGGMAATTIELRFFNPNGRVLEGELQFPLAPGQRVTGFALDIDGEMRPAVPVEKTRGRQVFEQIVRRGVDPGLLETTRGDNFKLRIYPVPAQGTRRVRVQLAQALDRAGGRWSYRLPLPYAATAGAIDTTVTVHGAAVAPLLPDAMETVAFQPTADGWTAALPRRALAGGALSLAGKVDDGARAYVGAFGDAGDESYFYAEIPVAAAPAPRTLPRTVGLLWDSSGSGATRRHEREFALLDRYFQAAGDIEVRLVRLRDRAEAPRSYRVRGGDWSALRRELEATVYDGATAFGGWTPERQAGEYLLVSDGLDNYGAQAFPALLPAQRLFVLNAAAGADSARLDALAQRHDGRLVDLNTGSADDAARALLTDGPRIAGLQGDGLADLQAESIEARGGVLRVAGRRLRPDALLHVRLAGPGGARGIDVPVTPASPRQPLAPLLWAGWRIDALQADYALKRGEIARLGKRFGIATRDTSLIVLERLDDYVRYDIAPPPDLRKLAGQMQALRAGQFTAVREQHLQRILRELDAKASWWNTPYPKGDAPQYSPAKPGFDGQQVSVMRAPAPAPMAPPPPPPAPAREAMPMAAPAPAAPAPLARAGKQVTAVGSRIAAADAAAQTPGAPGAPVATVGIGLQKWTPDARYLDRMRQAGADQAYAIYLDQKPDFANSTAFYLDVADLLLDQGKRELALRVLSNLAEMDLENRQVLRILGYRLLQAGAPELAVPVFETVLRLADDEPQSWRDLGLAYAAAGRPQDAVDKLYQVAVREWDRRFADVELIALADMNAIVAANRGKIDISRIDPRLLRHMPLDLRVVLTWDADNSDMDLWVTDPNGERCMYSNRLTYQGGQMSRDATGGYGPEEFSLRDAKPGKYKVEANFYGNRQQLLASSTTLQLKLTTGFGTPRARDRMVTLRLRGRGETVFVGEFEVPAGTSRR